MAHINSPCPSQQVVQLQSEVAAINIVSTLDPVNGNLQNPKSVVIEAKLHVIHTNTVKLAALSVLPNHITNQINHTHTSIHDDKG